ncbi:hypothetical protein [Zobellia alginiliquefaciens]|uniref:hypothetical protein n=1 Tax=Zobellia alginiliquefaciens TaxID=3032586 RepID=UPI0023E3C6E9|nr:hypothetical protein [Zobellia alginiliquefaciens]
MSKIVLKIEKYTNLPRTIGSIAKIEKVGMSEIKSRISENQPILERKLFYNNHNEVAKSLINLIMDLKSLGTSVNIYELEEEEEFNELDEPELLKIDKETLANILGIHDRETDRQQEL